MANQLRLATESIAGRRPYQEATVLAQALSDALLRLINNSELRAQMGKRSREIAVEEFSLEYVIAETLNIYKEQIG